MFQYELRRHRWLTHTKYNALIPNDSRIYCKFDNVHILRKYLEAAARQHQRKGEISILFLCSWNSESIALERCFPNGHRGTSRLIFSSKFPMFQMKFGKDGAHVIARIKRRCKKNHPI